MYKIQDMIGEVSASHATRLNWPKSTGFGKPVESSRLCQIFLNDPADCHLCPGACGEDFSADQGESTLFSLTFQSRKNTLVHDASVVKKDRIG